MNIEKIDNQTVKIILSTSDMKDFKISYDEMDYNNPVARKAIISLLKLASEQTSINLSQNKIFIEAFPVKGGGCVLYINLLGEVGKNSIKQEDFDAPLIFMIENLNELRRLCAKLYSGYNHLILKSSLYQTDEKYILTIYSYCKLDARLIAVVKEYGDFIGKGELKNRIIEEHALTIVQNNAIETIRNYIS